MSPYARLPWQLGLAGLLPFLATSLGLWLVPSAWQPALLQAFLAYGAVILSFLGGVHWGLVMPAVEPEPQAVKSRLLASMVPSLLGWSALLIGGLPGVVILAVGFLLVVVLEGSQRISLALPDWYLPLRWLLSLVVIGCHLLVIWRLLEG